jgi:allantoinase
MVDCGFYGGVVPGNADDLDLLLRRGALGCKAFLTDSGIDDFPAARAVDLDRAMPILAKAGVPLLVHAELEDAAVAPPWTGDDAALPQPYRAYLASRPAAWEDAAVQLTIAKAEAHRCRAHIVHLASASAAPLIAAARKAGIPVSAETCPHYLTFAAEDIQDGDTRFKCAPPIREAHHRDGLWRGLGEAAISMVVSDHSPCTPALKRHADGDFANAWGGIAGLQFGLASTWTGAQRRGFALTDVARWMCAAPAALVGLGAVKGRIAPGYAADLVVFDPERAVEVRAEAVLHRHKLTPYTGLKLVGAVEATFLGGALIYERGRILAGGPRGRPLLRRGDGSIAS